MDIISETKKLQRRIDESTRRFGRGKYGRVLKMAKKPTMDEFKKACLITGIGCILIGGLGFLIYLIWEHAPKLIRDILGI